MSTAKPLLCSNYIKSYNLNCSLIKSKSLPHNSPGQILYICRYLPLNERVPG